MALMIRTYPLSSMIMNLKKINEQNIDLKFINKNHLQVKFKDNMDINNLINFYK